MTGRGRTRRRGMSASSSSSPSLSSGQAVRLGIAVILMSSVIYLFCTHSVLSRESSGTGRVRNMFGVGAPSSSAGQRQGDHHYNYGSQVSYEKDPRQKALEGLVGGAQRTVGARDEMDFVELRCGETPPDVDLSYWKDIPADK